MHINKFVEPNLLAWVYRFLIGPAGFIDSVFETFTVNTVMPGLKLLVAKNLAKSRHK